MKRLMIPMFVVALAMFSLGTVEAQDKGKKKISPKLKLIIGKLDPQIKAAQTSLRASKKKLQEALENEVFAEKGAVEGKVIDQLKLAIKSVDSALARTNLAQALDKGD